MPTPEHTAKADQFHTMCLEVLDSYVTAIEKDMNNHAQRTGKPMDMTYAHNDVCRILFREIKPGVLAGMAAAAILREIERKGRGGRG
jgi:hypothetical protein